MRQKRVKAIRRYAYADWQRSPELRKLFSRSTGGAVNPYKRFIRALKRAANAERRNRCATS